LKPVASKERSVVMKKRTVLISLTAAATVLLVVGILVLDKADTGLRLSNGCGIMPPTVPGETGVLSMLVGSLEREYRLHLPVDYDQNTPTSLVLVFHGYTGDAQSIEYKSRMSSLADEHGYIVVYPQSTSFVSAEGTFTSWNDLSCNASPGPEGPTCSEDFSWPFPPECGEPSDCTWCTCHDDLAFVDQLMDELEDTLCIDPDRVYATGFSNGAMFVHRLGCDMADRFAAIVPVAGTLAKGFNCAPDTSTPISIMHIHGSLDFTVPADGTMGGSRLFFTPVEDVMDVWASAASQDCSDAESLYPTSEDGTREWECTQRANCATGSEVVSCSWKGTHKWPMSDDYDPFANNVIWEFFSKNSKQR
jgi:polyhydroxybutyrate depolymerase